MFTYVATLFVASLLLFVSLLRAEEHARFQYHHGDIDIPGASEDEPKLAALSVSSAMDYVEKGALVWARERKCVSCHTLGTYGLVRPQLAATMGKPSEELHSFFAQEVKVLGAKSREELKTLEKSQQVIYVAAGLAQWDANVSGTLSPATDQALRLMFELQLPTGSWVSPDCWPPLESSSFHAATVAAQAVAVAPGWVGGLHDPKLLRAVDDMKQFLRTGQPQNDYDRVSLLWAASLMPDLLTGEQKRSLIDKVFSFQNADGGWSLRSFSAPENWGSGLRAQRLRQQKDFDNPTSDGHMTGLAVLVLRKAGISKQDARIQRAIEWLRTNQRQSGRWYTKSLNTDNFQFITYSGTAYPLLALALCDEI